MPALACLNGRFTSPEEAAVPIWDRGFLFGDAIYEVWRVYRGRPWLDDAHYARLSRSLAEVRIHSVDLEGLHSRLHETLKRSGVQEGIIYVHVTRGVAPRRHAFPVPATPPTELIVVLPYDDTETAVARKSGITAISHPDLRWKRCDVKSTNLLANVLANQAAHEADAYEAILYDGAGLVTEATHSSLVWVGGSTLYGTPEGRAILPGTTRQQTLRLARLADVPFAEARVSLESLRSMDEVILLGTTIEVMPVVRLDGKPICSGEPGPVARRLQAAFRESIQRWLESPELATAGP